MVNWNQFAASFSRLVDMLLHQDVTRVSVKVEQTHVQDGNLMDLVRGEQRWRIVLNWADAWYEGLKRAKPGLLALLA